MKKLLLIITVVLVLATGCANRDTKVTPAPTTAPTDTPTNTPTSTPSSTPATTPTTAPIATATPTNTPTVAPTSTPTPTPIPKSVVKSLQSFIGSTNLGGLFKEMEDQGIKSNMILVESSTQPVGTVLNVKSEESEILVTVSVGGLDEPERTYKVVKEYTQEELNKTKPATVIVGQELGGKEKVLKDNPRFTPDYDYLYYPSSDWCYYNCEYYKSWDCEVNENGDIIRVIKYYGDNQCVIEDITYLEKTEYVDAYGLESSIETKIRVDYYAATLGKSSDEKQLMSYEIITQRVNSYNYFSSFDFLSLVGSLGGFNTESGSLYRADGTLQSTMQARFDHTIGTAQYSVMTVTIYDEEGKEINKAFTDQFDRFDFEGDIITIDRYGRKTVTPGSYVDALQNFIGSTDLGGLIEKMVELDIITESDFELDASSTQPWGSILNIENTSDEKKILVTVSGHGEREGYKVAKEYTQEELNRTKPATVIVGQDLGGKEKVLKDNRYFEPGYYPSTDMYSYEDYNSWDCEVNEYGDIIRVIKYYDDNQCVIEDITYLEKIEYVDYYGLGSVKETKIRVDYYSATYGKSSDEKQLMSYEVISQYCESATPDLIYDNYDIALLCPGWNYGSESGSLYRADGTLQSTMETYAKIPMLAATMHGWDVKTFDEEGKEINHGYFDTDSPEWDLTIDRYGRKTVTPAHIGWEDDDT